MPDGQTHVFIGAGVTAALLFLVNKFWSTPLSFTGIEWVMLAAVTYIYSQLPDIDSDVSHINKIWNTTAGIGAIYCFYTGQYKLLGMFAVASIVALEWVKHRGITHEEWFGIIIAAPLYFINPIYAIIGAVCYVSHIWADGDAFH